MCVLTLPLDVAYELCSEVSMLSEHEGINAKGFVVITNESF